MALRGGDTGIDAIGIIVNGSLVTDVDAIVDLADRSDYLDVMFVLFKLSAVQVLKLRRLARSRSV